MLARGALVLATSLAGARHARIPRNCSAGEWFAECAPLDAAVVPFDLRWPWAVALGTLVVLAGPTILLRSRQRGVGILMVCVSVLEALALMLVTARVPHRSMAYALSLHGAVSVLMNAPVGPWFVGEGLWAARYLAVAAIVAGAALFGPPLPIVEWPGQTGSVTCAALAHMQGLLLPDMVTCALAFCAGWARELLG